MRPAARALIWGALALGLTAAPAAVPGAVSSAASGHAAPSPAPLLLSTCELEHPLHLTAVAAQCGWLSVAENPQVPAGRHIRLRVARVPAINRDRRPDALFVLAGGPGMAATAFYAGVAGAFARIRRDRDIVLVDQRGTGGSNPLECPQGADSLYRANDAEIAADTARCLAGLEARANVTDYTTSVAARDLDQVRAALGYERIDLYGGSYGTRVAQHYLRRFPGRVRALILDGVVPVGRAIGPDTPLDAESALEAIFARCAHDGPCARRFGDPRATYQRLWALLAAHPVPVSVSDPTSGERQRLEFGAEQLTTVLRLVGYTSEYAALLPLLLDEAGAHADYAPLAAQFLLASREYGEVLALGMHNSVVCTEDVPFYDPRSIDRARLARTFLGTAQLDALAAVCRVWPRGVLDPDLHAPLASDVPALLLSGGDDPVTPPRYAAEAARGLSNSLSVVLAGFGHGQLTAPCMDRVLAEFLERAAVRGLDIACTRSARPMPFFTSRNGPAP
jgi:pimeloyl-ACP methyl ester carboxylesterase